MCSAVESGENSKFGPLFRSTTTAESIRGLKEAFAGKETAGVGEVRRAAELARKYAYEAVSAPAPGTILNLTASLRASQQTGIVIGARRAPADTWLESWWPAERNRPQT